MCEPAARPPPTTTANTTALITISSPTSELNMIIAEG